MINPGITHVIDAKAPAYSRVDKWAAWITVLGFAAALVVLARRKGWL